MIIILFAFRFKTTQTTTSHVYFGILVLILYCKFKLSDKLCNNYVVNYFIVCIHSTDTLTSWSREGIVTQIMVNSTVVKCLSSHLSSFAVIAEDPTIEVPIVPANISNTTSVIATATSTTSTVVPTRTSDAIAATATIATTSSVTTTTDIPPTPVTTPTTTIESTRTTDVPTSMNLLTCKVNLRCI